MYCTICGYEVVLEQDMEGNFFFFCTKCGYYESVEGVKDVNISG